MNKKFLSLLLVLTILFGVVPFSTINVTAADASHTVNASTAASRTNMLVNSLVGKYFTTTQATCGNSQCDRCKNSNVIGTSWLKNTMGLVPNSVDLLPEHYYSSSDVITSTAWSCAGFANYCLWYIYAKNPSDNVRRTNIYTGAFTKSDMDKSGVRTGDVVRVGDSHSFVYISHDNSGVTVLDSNWNFSHHNLIQKHVISWSWRSGQIMAITRGKNWSAESHIHNYAGQRVHETAHPHAITQRCVDYVTCGGYIVTGEYAQVDGCSQCHHTHSYTSYYEAAHPHKVYKKCSCGDRSYIGATKELNTCSSCWYASFNLSASSISINVGESKTISATVSGCYPDTVKVYGRLLSGNGVVEIEVNGNKITFKALKKGIDEFEFTVYSDSSKSHLIARKTIPISVSQKTYTVSYDANGGSGAPGNQIKNHGEVLVLSNTIPKKTGYKFTNWSSQPNGGGYVASPGGKYTNDNAVIWYAQYAPIQYRITYHANGGTGSTAYSTHTYDSEKALTSNGFVKSGYTFLGWSKDPSASLPAYKNGETVKNLTAIDGGDITLYAVWKKVFYGDIDSDGVVDYRDVVLLNKARLGKVEPTNWMKFVGDLDADGSITMDDIDYLNEFRLGKSYGFPAETMNKLYMINTVNKNKYYVGDTVKAEDISVIIFYPSTETIYDVTEYSNIVSPNTSTGGVKTVTMTFGEHKLNYNITVERPQITVALNTLSLKVGESTTIRAETKPSGQTISWKSSNTEVASVTNGNIIAKSSGTASIYASFVYNGIKYETKCGVTVDAKTYTVSYNANGGSGAPGNQTKYHDTTLVLSSGKPNRPRYTFLGWSISPTATSATYQPGSKFYANSDTTLYAVWRLGCEGDLHSYSYEVTKTPTESATGVLTGVCSKCNVTCNIVLPKLNTTDYSYEIKSVATCTEAGSGRYVWKNTEYGICCFDVAIPATGHSYTNKVTAPTCTEQGYTTHTCSCGYSYNDTYTDATGHSYSYEVTEVPTTSAPGTLTSNCLKCSDITTVTLPKLTTTDYDYSVAKEATCTTNGAGRYIWKTITYGIYYFKVAIPATGHSYIDKVIAPTCTEQGYTTHKCSNCGDIYIDSYISTVPHTPGAVASCTKDQLCTECGEVVKAKLGHDYEERVTKPTCTEKGYTTHTCTRCDDEYVDSYVSAADHTPGEKATCTKDQICTACGQTLVEKKGHDYEEEWTVDREAGINIEGSKSRHCKNCDEVTDVEKIPALANPNFNDVKEHDWYYEAVAYAVSNGLFNGTSATTFSPNADMTRAMLVTVLYRMEGSPSVAGVSNAFTDVKAGQYYTDAVLWASSNGVVNGVGAGKFAPNSNVTREQMATILYRYSEKKGIDVSTKADISAFPDSAKVSDYAKDAMAWANGTGLIGGTNSGGKVILDPLGNATRAHVAAIIMRYKKQF